MINLPARWPIEQEKYLEDAWGEVSIPHIAKKLGRTVNAVKLKARKMGLKRHIHSGSYITLNQLFNALDISYNAFTLDRWRRHGFPLRHKQRPLPADKSFWTPEQEAILEDLYYKGYIPEVMAEFIPKSALAIQGKVERMEAEGRLAPDRFREEKEPEKQKKP